MATTPKSNTTHFAQLRTPSSKHRLQFKISHTSPNPSSALKENQPPLEHPVEVIGRIRDYPDRQKERPTSGSGLFHINPDRETIRVRTDIGYRDFSLDGVSSSENEDLESFYKKFIESRIVGVKMGAKCTIMMYGPTGSGKSHNMFGCPKQPGIVYRSLKDILGEDGEEKSGVCGLFVHVTVLEIYNEEIYDLLSCEKASGGFNIWSKGSASKVKLEVMGKKAKNATFILGTEAAKLSKEIQKVEKRRIVKSTNCNDRSSRSHCMIILDVPTVGGRLMLVDMAGSENIEQAGQVGFEAKMQTAKINQGNTALKRVVESIANGDSHVPFRDSKLTMLLQDSFEDDKSKILMILCASPDPKEMHKTISTLEYGAKAKCIIRGPHTPVKDKNGAEDMSSTVVLGSRIAAMDQFILKLQMENKQREKERNEAHKQLVKKEEEVSQLRAKLEQMQVQGSGASEEEINVKVNERMQMLKQELDKQLKECQRMASEYVELERKRMEEKIIQQQQEVLMLRRRLEEMELELNRSRDGSSSDGSGSDLDGIGLARRLKEMYADEDPGMEKSMDLDMGDQESYGREVKIVGGVILNRPSTNLPTGQGNGFTPSINDRVCLSTVFEEEEVEDGADDQKAKPEDEEVEKEVIEEKRVLSAIPVDKSRTSSTTAGSCGSQIMGESTLDTESSRRMRIQNIFTLCGNYRELSRHIRNPEPAHPDTENADPQSVSVTSQYPVENSMRASNTKETTSEFPVENSMRASNTKETTTKFPVGSPIKESRLLGTPVKNVMQHLESKENMNSGNDQTTTGALMDIYVKWEATKESQGKFISKLRIVKDASLADLRKLIDIHLGIDRQDFTFLALGDPTGAPVPREKEATVSASKLPACNNQLGGHLACLRPAKGVQVPSHMPFSSLENKLPITPISCLKQQQADSCSPNLDSSLGSTPFVTVRR